MGCDRDFHSVFRTVRQDRGQRDLGVVHWDSSAADPPRVSIGIPLYRSARFFDVIVENIEAMPADGVEILISDRHCADDTLERLMDRFGEDRRLRWLRGTDALDWVGHINLLMSEARGDYWRFLPHDDLSPPGTLERLIDTLDRDPEAILAYGPTPAIDLAGNHLPERDRLAPHGISMDAPWTLRVALDMFWEGYFDGAFKGLIRRSAICSPALPIRSTRDQILPERAWLFALCLKGRFRFVADATYVKRFYADSTHASWVIDDCHLLSASGVMMHYASEAIADSGIRHLAIEYLTQRLRERLGWSETASVTAERPAAEILHGLQPQGFRGGSHGFRSPSIGHEDAIRHMLNQSVPG